MELTQDDTSQKNDKQCTRCLRNPLPYEIDWSCISCNYNILKRKNEPSKFSRKKNCLLTD